MPRRSSEAVVSLVPMALIALSLAGGGPAAASAPPPSVARVAAVLADRGAGDGQVFGTDVSMSADGRTLAVGEPRYVPSEEHDGGRVTIWAAVAGTWVRQATVRPSVIPPGGFGAHIALSADGNHLAVAAPDRPGIQLSEGGQSAGGVATFDRTGVTWHQTGRVSEPHPLGLAWFGTAVALSSDGRRMLVTAPFEPSSTNPRGAGTAYVFARVPGSVSGWALVDQLNNPTGPQQGNFGEAAALSGSGRVAVIGGWGSTAGTTWSAGNAVVYTADSHNVWSISQVLTAAAPVTTGGFGRSVAVSDSGATIAVGATGTSAVTVFHRDTTRWLRVANFLGGGTAINGMFGWAVALSPDGQQMVVGAPYRTAGLTGRQSTGGAYRYARENGVWRYVGLAWVPTSVAFDYVGDTVAISGDGRTVLLGAPGYRADGGSTWGAVDVLTVTPAT